MAPFTVDIAPGRLRASGTFTVRQSALGLAPFSVLLGALRVQDDMRVKFDSSRRRFDRGRDAIRGRSQAADSVNSRMVVPSGAVIMAAGSCRNGGGT